MRFNAPELPTGAFVELGLAAATTLDTGELAAINAAGNILPAADTAGLRVLGRVEADADNSGGAAGDVSGLVKAGVFKYDNSETGVISAAHVGKQVFIEDSTTVSSVPGTNGIVAGIVRRVDSDGVWVDTTLNAAGGPGGAHDADGRTLTAADGGKVFSNLGAAGAAAFALPPSLGDGLDFYFAVKVAQQLRIDPNGTETIELPSTAAQGAAGKYLVADAIGEFVHVRSIVAGTWSVVASGGTWTHEA